LTALLRTPTTTEPLSVILKLVGEACNINCYYCYEKRKPYERSSRIPLTTVTRLLTLAEGRPLSLELHGGEPLLYGLKQTRALLAVLREYPGKISLSIQTNATMVDEAWLDMFAEEWPDIDIGFSLDGDAEANGNRVDYRDRNTTDQVERALSLAAHRRLNVGVISTVTSDVVRRPADVLDFFAGFEAIRVVKFSPCFDFNVRPKHLSPGNKDSLLLLDTGGEGHAGWAITPNEFADFLLDAYDHWRSAGLYRRFLVEPFTSVLRTIAGTSSKFCHFSESKCAFVMTLYPDGSLGSCDELGMDDALLGNVYSLASLNDVVDMRTNSVLKSSLDNLLMKCTTCDYQTTCGGGCLATRRRYLGSSYYDDYCDYRIRLVDHVRASLDHGEDGVSR
jgi:uncharacterized protein